MSGLRQDLKLGLRRLARSPGYAVTAVLILGLGIGANTAMFSVIDGVLLEPLPFRDGDELVLLQYRVTGEESRTASVSVPELHEYRERLESVRDLVEYHNMSFTLLDQGEPDRVDTGVVSANFFDVLGVRPSLGRTFVDGDDDPGAEAVLVLAHDYWMSRFGGDPEVVGRALEMNDRTHTVVGVLPDYPQYPEENHVYMPTSACPMRAMADEMPGSHRSFAALQVFGRLAPGVSAERASQDVAALVRSFEREHPRDYETPPGVELAGEAVLLDEALVADARSALYVLVGVALLVLLIAAANVANLALARTLRRGREMALRTALGSSRGQLLRQLVTESVLLAIAGGAVGVVLAWVSTDLLVHFVGRFTSHTGQISVDGGVLAFALAVSVATGVAFGTAPALALRRDLAAAIRDGGAQSGEGAGKHRVRSGLVVAQVAVSFALVVAAAVLLQSFYRLATKPLGFETEKVMTAAIYDTFSSHATSAADMRRFESQVLAALRSSPGIRAAALTGGVPQSAIVPGRVPVTLRGIGEGGESEVEVDRNFVSDQYFESLGVPLLAGRDFRASDTPESPLVAIVNQSMARLWNGADPVGRTFTRPGGDARMGSQEPVTYTVIGVAADYRLYDVARENPAQYYLPVGQNPGTGTRLLARVEGDPASAVSAIKAAVHGADPRRPVEDLATIAEIRNTTHLAAPRLTATLLSLFALVALAITLAGIGGVIGTAVTQRTREFGVRMALGASRTSVLRTVLRQALVLAAVGIAAGAAGALLFNRLLTSFLFETPAADPLAFAGVGLLLAVASVLAAAGPARRATSIDPLEALRAD